MFFLLFLVILQMKTVSVALVLCLNVGVDPPDIVKTQPCARLECWIGKFLVISVDSGRTRLVVSDLRCVSRPSFNEPSKSFGNGWCQFAETVRKVATSGPIQAEFRPNGRRNKKIMRFIATKCQRRTSSLPLQRPWCS